MAEQTETAVPVVELTKGQRLAACDALASDINAAGGGLSAKTWQVQGANKVGISIFKDGLQYATATVNGKGYIAFRNVLKNAPTALVESLKQFGIESNPKFPPTEVNEYKVFTGGNRFDLSRIQKGA
jgi:hypothetical protein